MDSTDAPSLNGIRSGLVGDHRVKIACVGRVDCVTDQIRIAAKINREDKGMGIVFG